MKKLFVLGFVLLMFGKSNAQVALPSATAPSVTIPWSLPSNCTAANSCPINVYRIQAICPTTLAGSTGWTLVATTAAQATSYKDTTVASSTLYSYDVEAVPTGSTGVYSGPSNCVSITTLFTPNPPVIGTITTP